jgi:hypothetical protein
MSSVDIKTKVTGHVLVQEGRVLRDGELVADELTGKVSLDKFNAVHPAHMAEIIARGLANSSGNSNGTHQIYALALGNGGSSVDALNQITYLPPNVHDDNAALYNQTYFEIVDESRSNTPAANSVTYQNTNDGTSVVIVTMTIAAGEPFGQNLTDTPADPNFNSTFSFDELALYSNGTTQDFTDPALEYSDVPNGALLLTHIVFSPILKTANRELVITYTLTISVS